MNLILSINLDANPWIAVAMFASIFVFLLVAIFLYKKIRYGKAQKSENLDKSLGETPSVCPAEEGQAPSEYAPGRSGTLKLVRVQDRDAALLMAIVAEEMQIPLNQIIFKSITCCEDNHNEI